MDKDIGGIPSMSLQVTRVRYRSCRTHFTIQQLFNTTVLDSLTVMSHSRKRAREMAVLVAKRHGVKPEYTTEIRE
jgi:hypothetical protein